MANKAISELPQAQNVNNQDLFVLEQSGITKKLTAETFITEQGIIDALAAALDGHGGIQSVTLSSVSGRIRTYLITFTDQSATTFQVLDGTSISRIEKTSTAGLVDTYTVFMTDGTTSFFQVRNGQDGSATWDQINGKAPAITDTASGAIANIPDGAEDIPVTSLVANIDLVQDLNGYDNPWPAGGGKNEFNPSTATAGYVQTNGNIHAASSSYEYTSDYIAITEATISGGYNAVASGETPWVAIGWFDSSKSFLSRSESGTAYYAFTVPQNAAYVRVSMRTYNHGVANCFACNGTATASSFAPYSNICPITGWTGVNVYHESAYDPTADPVISLSWQNEAGTVYGGTIDVATGLLTVNASNKVDLSTLSYGMNLYGFDDVYKDVSNLGYTGILACEMFPVRSSVEQVRDLGGVAFVITGNGGQRIVFRILGKTASETKDIILAQANNIVFTVAPSQTYQLTPQEVKTLLGTNNVWADTGDTSVTYTADTKQYVNNAIPTKLSDFTDDLGSSPTHTHSQYLTSHQSVPAALSMNYYRSLFKRKGLGISVGTRITWSDSTVRLAITTLQYAENSISITCDTGYYFGVQICDASDIVISDSGWKTSYTVPAGKYFHLVVKNSTATTITLGEISHLYVKEENFNLASHIGLKSYQKVGALVKSVNHRGYNSIAPENTLPAYKLSRQYGFEYAETDVQFTSDGVAVCIHDTTIDRTSSGSGNIADISYATAITYDWGSWKSADYAGTVIPTFEEFIALCKNIGLKPYVELKAGTQAQIEGLVDTVKAYGMLDNTTWISFTSTYLSYVTAKYSKARIGFLNAYGTDIDAADITTAQSLQTGDNEVFIDVRYSALTSTGISLAIAANIPIEVYDGTLNNVLAMDGYVTGVTADSAVASDILYYYNINV